MYRKQFTTALLVASQTLPFLMITATFVGIAYACGQTLTAYQIDPSFDLIRLSWHHIP
ncbi:MAG TPA: hypothetical protein VMW10_13125 [Alphaproteobacteria bacterium]|nr:hypothetical protein [Alphaproteobacteria bacterium]